jgi:hypothetical protein
MTGRQSLGRGRSPGSATVSRSSCGSCGFSRRASFAGPKLSETNSGRLVGRDDHKSTCRPCLSLKDACRFVRSIPRWGDPKVPPVRSGLLSWGSKIAPPPIQTMCVHSQVGKPTFRPEGANLQARSVHVVPPDSDGLLRASPCRSIAPCNRPWGSPCFRRSPPGWPEGRVGACSILDGAYPSKLFPP